MNQSIVTGNMQNPRRKTQGLKTKGARFLFPALCLVWFSLGAAAQDSPYSADSLMASFKKGSAISLKGTEITLTGVIAETKKSRVLFKSSRNDKVICQLVSVVDNGSPKLLVGSPLTVVGRVRGRGILGNVTLDDCSPALSDRTQAPSEVILEEPTPPEASAEQLEGPAEDQIENPLEATNIEAVTPSAFPVSVKRLTRTGRVPARRPKAKVIPDEGPSPQGTDQPNKATGGASTFFTETLLPNAFYASVALLAGLAILALVKSPRALIPARLRTSPNVPTTPEMRRDALEALLLGQKKKK